MANLFDDILAPSESAGGLFDDVLATPKLKEQGDFMRSLGNYIPQMKEMGNSIETIAGVGAKKIGLDSVGDYLMEDGLKGLGKAKSQMASKDTDSFSGAWDKGIGSVIQDWLPYQVGQAVGNVGEGLIAAGAGALIGGAVGTSAAPGVGTAAGGATGFMTGLLSKSLVKSGVMKIATELAEKEGADVAKAYLVKEAGKVIGGNAAVATMAVYHGYGETGSRVVEEAQKAGLPLDQIDMGRYLASGAGHAALEFIGDKIALGGLKADGVYRAAGNGVQPFAKTVGGNVLKVGAKEAPVEIAQTGVERFAAGLDLTNEDARREYLDAGMAAAAMGVTGAPGGVRSYLGGDANPTPATPPADPLRLGNTPDPLISFPDGTLARRSEFEAHIANLPEDQRVAARAKFMGLGPQKATVEDVLQSSDFDAAIANFQNSVEPIGKAWQDLGITPTGDVSNILAHNTGSEYQALGINGDGSIEQQRSSYERMGAMDAQLRAKRLAQAGQDWQALGIAQPADDLEAQSMGMRGDISGPPGKLNLKNAGAAWQSLGIDPSGPVSNLSARQVGELAKALNLGDGSIEQQRAEIDRVNAQASTARDSRLADIGKQFQDLGITNPADDLRAQRMREEQPVASIPPLSEQSTQSAQPGTTPTSEAAAPITQPAQPVTAEGAGGSQPTQVAATPALTPRQAEVAKIRATLTRAQGVEAAPAVVLQNRDRSSASSIAQMQGIAARPDYLRTGQSTVMDTGAPIAFGDTPTGATVGREVTIADGKGDRVKVQYAVVEAADLITSHQADGAVIPSYANGVPGKLRAVAGNGRAAGITEAYRMGTANQYRADLSEDAQSMGIDRAAVDAMQSPVLIRVMAQKDVSADIGDRSNIASAARMSPVEQAATDAKRLDLGALEFTESGDPTPTSIQQFIRAMPTSEQGELMNPDGTPGKQAIDRLMAAAFKQAYGSDELVQLYAQATDTEARTIMSALADAAGAMQALRDAGDLDIRGAVSEAAGLAINAKRRGEKLSDYLKTADMTASGEAFVIARFFADNIRSAKKISEGLRNWATYAAEQAQIAKDNLTQDGMFGAAPVATRDDIFRRIENGREQEGARIGQRAGPVVADAGTQRAQDNPEPGQVGATVGAAKETTAPVAGHQAPLEAGQQELDEARALPYKTTDLARMLDPAKWGEGIDVTDAFHMHLLAYELVRARAYNAIMVKHNGDPQGVEHKNPNRDAWAFVLPDASDPGKWRVSFFGKEGFQSHNVADTSDSAVQLMVGRDYTEESIGKLDELATTKEWARGSYVATLIQELNQGKITHAQMNAKLQAYQDETESGLTGQTNDEILAEQARVAQLEKDKAKAESDAVAADKRRANMSESERRAADILAEREAAKALEIAPENFEFGADAPKPVDKKVTAKEKRGQQDVFDDANQPATPEVRAGAATESVAGPLKTEMSSKEFDAWVRKNATNQRQQFAGEAGYSGEEGVGTIALSGSVEQKQVGGVAGVKSRTVDGRDIRLVYRTDDGKLVWWDGKTRSVYEVKPNDSRVTITIPEPADRQAAKPTEATVTVDGDEHSVMFDEPLSTISDQLFEDNLYENGIAGNIKAEFRKLREQQKPTTAATAQTLINESPAPSAPTTEAAPIRNGDILRVNGNDYTVVDTYGNTVDAERTVSQSGGSSDKKAIALSAIEAIAARDAYQKAADAESAQPDAESKPTTEAAQTLINESPDLSANEKIKLAADLRKGEVTPEDVSKVLGKPAAKIEDVGEKLGGAKKDKAPSLSTELSDADLAAQPLSKIWPASEIDAIEDPFIAAVATTAREAIPAKPRVAYKVKSWVEKVKVVRSIALKVLNGEVSRDRLSELMNGRTGLNGFVAKINLLEAIDRSAWGRIGKVDEWPDAVSYDPAGNKVKSPLVFVEIDGKNIKFDGASSVADVTALVAEKLGVAAPDAKLQFEVRSFRDGRSFINKTGDKEKRKLKEFASSKEAHAYLKDNYADVVAAWDAVKERDNVKESDVRNDENRPRTGEDRRQGRDVSAEEFASTFGFRGVEFGNWVSQGKNAKERQGMINQAFDALHDLAEIVGVPPKAISLNGTLGLGFGSRGSGGNAAHFEPDTLVINLTKTRGAGSLGHEWFHALDNYFARQRGGEVSIKRGENAQQDYRQNNYITYKPEPLYVHKTKQSTPLSKAKLEQYGKDTKPGGYYDPAQWHIDPKHPAGVRPEVEAAFAELVKALDESPMLQRAQKNDKAPDGYWSRIIERAARSFENYVISKMLAKGYNNDYLANVVDVENFGRDKGRYPYLLPDENAPIAEAFENLFSTIQTKETEGGNVAMFSRNQSRPKGLTSPQSVRDAITAKFPSLTKAVNRMLELGKEGKRGGLVVIDSAQESEIARVYASKTGRSVDDVLSDMRGGSDNVQTSEDGFIQGIYDPSSGLTFIVAPNVTADTAAAVALHEAYHGQESKTINERAQALIDTADSKGHTKATREVLQEARQKMEDAGEAGNERESAAYIIESAVQRGREAGFSVVDGKFMDWVDSTIGKRIGNIIRDFVSMVRAHALRIGMPLKLSIDDLLAYAKLGIETASQGTTVDGDGVLQSERMGPRTDVSPVGFFSALARNVDAIKAKALTGSMWADGVKGLVNKGLVKADEVEWTGLGDWLKMQDGKVTKEQVMEFLKGNGVQVKETVLGGDITDLPDGWTVEQDRYGNWNVHNSKGVTVTTPQRTREAALAGMPKSEKPTKYTQYQLPGGTNYREVLLTLPKINESIDREITAARSRVEAFKEFQIEFPNKPIYKEREASAQKLLDELLANKASQKTTGNYQSSHWDQPNVLAHIRLNDRVDADGKRVLLVEEIQSDHAQDYRKSVDAISKAVDNDFLGIVERMKRDGVLEVNCD